MFWFGGFVLFCFLGWYLAENQWQ